MPEEKNIWEAIADGNAALFEKHLNNGFSAVSKDDNGYTPLMAAVSYGKMDMLNKLIEHLKTDDKRQEAFEMRDEEGDTIYHHFAMSSGDLNSDSDRDAVLNVLKKYFPSTEDLLELKNGEDQSPFEVSLEFDEEGRKWFFSAHGIQMPEIKEVDENGNMVMEAIEEGDESEETKDE